LLLVVGWVPWGQQGPASEGFANLLGKPGVGNPAWTYANVFMFF